MTGARFVNMIAKTSTWPVNWEQKTGFTMTPDSLLIQMISAPHSDERERDQLALFPSATAAGAEPRRSRAQLVIRCHQLHIRSLFAGTWRSAIGWLLQR